MKRFAIPLLIALTLSPLATNAKLVVISHDNITNLSASVIKRIYTGRLIEVEGVTVTPINAQPLTESRNQFLLQFLKKSEDEYTAYWTVRRFIGKGTPPKELGTQIDIIEFVRNTSGAIGYVDDENLDVPDDVFIHNP